MDNFYQRETFRKLKTSVELDIFKKQDVNKIYKYNDFLVEQIYPLDEKSITNLTNKINYIKDNYLKVTSANGIAYLDYDGNKKDAKDIFTNNEIFAKEQNGKWGYVDKNGNTVVDFKYDMAIDLNEYGFGAVKQNGRWGVVDSKGNEVKAPTYELNEYAPNFIGEYYEVSSLYEVAYFTNEI